ncbi:YggT family protein [Guyparkeria halophila]|uniref:YggT family protein n=1 Tax=Guyparkeria halophila TaxID=47960 RepID=A0ABZ0YV81_9GAMM|nr:YggT family protein [Guyparkeria halophila]WQH16081.1 YggT family protein [Guyparkeria halophila]
MSGSFGDPSVFLVRVLFELVAFVAFARYFLQLFRANFYNPVTQAIVKITDPVLNPLRTVIKPVGRHDLAALVFGIVMVALMVWAITAMRGVGMTGTGVLIGTIYFTFLTVTNLFFWTVLLRAVASWLGNDRSPGVAFLADLTDPVVDPIRRVLPPIGGIDLSPLAVLLIIQVAQMVVGNLLMG